MNVLIHLFPVENVKKELAETKELLEQSRAELYYLRLGVIDLQMSVYRTEIDVQVEQLRNDIAALQERNAQREQLVTDGLARDAEGEKSNFKFLKATEIFQKLSKSSVEFKNSCSPPLSSF
ncbi:hypothetical protein CRE_06335 [Caenorhabditis remanei]|uniref:Uncharacterized protein n=1 Tax=Caenorhabditis remanei TaxID=31234 RepID=E3M1I4_CAERE|nr:hypothetical protein CRE_06335 [Caenorhabditis remanei]